MLLGLRLQCHHKIVTLAVVAQLCTTVRYMSVSVEMNNNNCVFLRTMEKYLAT